MLPRPAFIVLAFCFAVALTTGCDSDKDQFSGLSDMVAGRQKARQTISDKNRGGDPSEKNESPDLDSSQKKADTVPKSKRKLDSGILFEKQIQIVDTQSNTPLARGVAYLDKQGHIVRIRIIEN